MWNTLYQKKNVKYVCLFDWLNMLITMYEQSVYSKIYAY